MPLTAFAHATWRRSLVARKRPCSTTANGATSRTRVHRQAKIGISGVWGQLSPIEACSGRQLWRLFHTSGENYLGIFRRARRNERLGSRNNVVVHDHLA